MAKRNGSKNEPVATFEFPVSGGRIDVAVWENSVGEGDEERQVNAVSFSRSFHDGKDWQRTQSMRTNDLPVLMVGLQKAYGWIIDN